MLAALRKIAVAVIVVFFLMIAIVFAYGNQEPIAIDIGIARLEDVSLTVVLICAFATGTIFGAAIAGLTLLRFVRERRQLRRELKVARAELDNLRRLPLQDAN
ncbi:MAG: lipopolysaccharide assembly protein LapA domain-containing protein [Gammaproteobacteria bacterium]|nr:lipopolysaccharide assembly protein LapA domain-containing protein [Gammaproteobacteria bacterium]